MLNSEVPYVRYLDRSDREDVRLHQLRCHNASAYGLRGYVDNTLPSRCYAITMICCVYVGIFLKLLRSPTVASEVGLCVDVICTSRTQRVVDDNSTNMSYFDSVVLLDEAAQTDITRTLTRDWFYRRASHTGGYWVSISPALVENSANPN